MKIIITSILLILTSINVVYSQCYDFYRQTPNGNKRNAAANFVFIVLTIN